MGVLHFKAELSETIKLNPRKVNLSCADLTKAVSGTSDDGKSGYVVNTANVQCSITNGDFSISVLSKGTYLDREDKIKAKLYVKNMRGSTLNSGEIPKPIDYDDTLKVLNSSGIFMNGVYRQTEKSLQVKGEVRGETGNSGGGNDILIQRNLYVDKDIYFHNHGCLVVRGDLVVTEGISSGNKVYIFVYGDIYFNSYTYTSSNNRLFVTGNEYVNGVKVTKKFAKVPSGSKYSYSGGDCTLSSPNTGVLTPIWDFNGETEVDYFVD
ncbi:hypothetical protein BCM40_09755 [Planococcus donghaensis]|uniref:Uncharacterized protein n=2 Tax=Planococcus donghaensis TaxID=414778 RepID=A0A1C7EMF1_9BACL|nr:hypothetical protein BCM40_09755 [Planococcus donghaensis]